MSLLPVTVIITTYDPGDNSRYPLLYQTVDGLLKNLDYPELHWLVTDDGSPNHADMVEKLSELLPTVQVINTERHGVGYAKNNALREAFKVSGVVLLLEDDWWLVEKLPLVKYVQHLLDHPDIGIIRFGYIGGSTLEAYYRGYSPFDTYWELKRGSDVYVYSGQVSLRSKCLYDTVGYHQEGVDPGKEELDYCIRYNAAEGAPKILWPAEYGTTLNAGPFHNIGLGSSLNNIQPG